MTGNPEFFFTPRYSSQPAGTGFAPFMKSVWGEPMRLMAIIIVIFALAGSPALAGMIEGQEADEAATCELRGAGMVKREPENGVVFPQDANCVEAETDSREMPSDEARSVIDIAGYLSAAGRHLSANRPAVVVSFVD
jgi:hypothetical protein